MIRGFAALKRRLDRLWQAHQARLAEQEAERERQAEAGRMAALLRAGLARAGIDPDTVPAMRRYERAIAAAADPPPEPPSPARDPAAWLRAKFLDIRERHRERPLDLADASPAQLFAVYCFDPDAPDLGGLCGVPSG
jgi:hypothetical protein